jgi:tetratricopeptide (TPR) repeat protein
MGKALVAFPAGLLLLSFSISPAPPAVAQAFTDPGGYASTPGYASIPRAGMPQLPGQAGASADPSVIVVRPELTDEQMGDLYMVRKQYREAATIFKRLSDAAPQNPVYLNKLGITMHQQEALALALKYYERAVKADPLYADAQNNIGTVWYQRKKYNKAIRAYQKAINIRRDMPVLYSNLAYAYFEDKKYEQSIASFRQALAIDPHYFEEHGSRTGSVLQDRTVNDRGRFYFLLAKSFAEAGNVERSLVYLRKAKDEGYKALEAARQDPAFSAMMKDPEVQEALSPKPTDPPSH